MENETRINLAACLHTTSTDLSEVARGLTGLSTDDEIEQQARILDRIAEDASEGAAILRALIAQREHTLSPLPRRVPRDAANMHRVPPAQVAAHHDRRRGSDREP